MGFWSSVGSAISSACSSIGSALSSACSSVLTGLSTVVSNLAPLANALAVAIPAAGVLGKAVLAIQVLSIVLGVIGKDDTIEDIGDRAIQAQEAGINPENYSTYREYVDAIKSFELDPKKSKEISSTEKMIAGLGVQYWGFEESFGIGAGDIIVKTLKSPDYFTGERLTAYLDKVESISDVVAYFDSKLSKSERLAVEEKLVEAEKTMSPEKSDFTIHEELLKHSDE